MPSYFLAAALGAVVILGCSSESSFETPAYGPGGQGAGGTPTAGQFAPQNPLSAAQPNECGGVTLGTKKVPLYIVVALDRSNSMGKNGKWQAATTGLAAFFEAQHPDVSASLALFPQIDRSCDGNYVQPSVPMAALPNSTFRSTFSQVQLLGGTPIRPALEGAAVYANALQQQVGTLGRVVVALVSDGAPSASLCAGNTLTDVVNVALAARNQAGILTYAIGMPGALQGNLDQIANAGGTNQGTLLSSVDPGAQLTATFESIRSQFDCEVALPKLEQDKKYALDQVNVLFTPAGGTASTVPYSNACASAEGWRYDNPASPSRIVLCPQTCTRGRTTSAQVQVKLGCATEGEKPR